MLKLSQRIRKKHPARHPWVDRDALQPKAIALEMYDDHLSFNDFLKQLSRVDKTKRSTRQEGLLLRYLSQVHKTMRHDRDHVFDHIFPFILHFPQILTLVNTLGLEKRKR